MSGTQKVPDELKDLIDECLTGLIEDSRLRELDERLAATQEARHYFVRYCRMHTDLYLDVRARQAGERALRRLDEAATQHIGVVLPPESAPIDRKGIRHFFFALQSSRLAKVFAAAVVLVAVGIGWWFTREQTEPNAEGTPNMAWGVNAGASGLTFWRVPAATPEVAWLVNAQNCQWADDSAPVGDMRAGAVLRVQHGLAEIRFRSGARVVLQGPASLELLSAKSARLLHGKLTAKVPGQAIGFEILSPQGKVVDLGTEFGLAVAENGRTDVYVFEGKVEASPTALPQAKAGGVSITENQSACMEAGGITLRPDAQEDDRRFVRAIVSPPVIVPRELTLDFRREIPTTIRDSAGTGTGLTHRLPGTGTRLPEQDANLRLDPDRGQLELTTTNSDINTQFKLYHGEYLGVRLSELGFTGKEDFAVTAYLPNIPALQSVGQFGLYAGAGSDKNIRGGLIRRRIEPEQYTQFLVNNNGGSDTDPIRIGLLSTGDDLRLTLRRTAGKYSLTVENQTTGGSSTLSVRHLEFLDTESDLYVGLFGANTQSEVRKTLIIKEFSVTVWTVAPTTGANRAD
jgi:hypothetical protein